MSKQKTLFQSWTTRRPRQEEKKEDEVVVIDEEGLEIGLDDDDLQQFFVDDVSEAIQTQSEKAVEEGRGKRRNLHNSSVFEDIPGFDHEAGEVYIYPSNYPVRDYQINIVKKALFQNTLVCLPTGLGKTFIAAVVMYNFYRWYPKGKVIFLAPTKPLVTQQIQSCHNVMGIPHGHTAEMTGSIQPKERNILWEQKSVFFLTPQVMQNDLARGSCPACDVTCIVFDEAHKALGNHSYCQVIREMVSTGGKFRVLALSATPGNDLKAVQQVLSNLLVAHIELRGEDSLDVRPYIHERKVEKIVVPLEGEILEIKNIFKRILTTVVSRLNQQRALYHCDVERLSKFQILQARDEYRNRGYSGPQSGPIEGDFGLAISLFHAFELLQQHGLRSFYHFLYTNITEGQSRARTELGRNWDFTQIMQQLKPHFDTALDLAPQLNTSIYCPTVPHTGKFFYSHPKLKRLEQVVLEHFRNSQSSSSTVPVMSSSSSSSVTFISPPTALPLGSSMSRVMIFSQYRESVREIADLLSQHTPLVRVMSFMGQSSTGKTTRGQTQREQIKVVRKFRDGGYNTLVSTCVGEEGLDIGEVDLIICFDAHKSPIRLVQRMGRTGRSRKGRIVALVAEGREEHIYSKSQSNKNSIVKAIRESCSTLQLYQFNPRMIPRHLYPEVRLMHMDVEPPLNASEKKGVSKREGKMQSKLKFGPGPAGPKGAFLTDEELAYWSHNFVLPDKEARDIEKAVTDCIAHKPIISVTKLSGGNPFKMCRKSRHHAADVEGAYSLSVCHWMNWQTAPERTFLVGHSKSSSQLRSSLNFIDLMQTNNEIGQNYDLEMEMFLCGEDVKDTREIDSPNVDFQCRRRRRRVISDSSDDENFVRVKVQEKKSVPSTSSLSAVAISSQENIADPDQVSSSASGMEPSDKLCKSSTLGSVAADSAVAAAACEPAPPPSQCSNVPRPPEVDILNWLDTVTPSQIEMPNSTTTLSQDPTHFATPKVPLSDLKKQKALGPEEDQSNLNAPGDSYEMDHFSDMGSVDLFEFDDIEDNICTSLPAQTEISSLNEPGHLLAYDEPSTIPESPPAQCDPQDQVSNDVLIADGVILHSSQLSPEIIQPLSHHVSSKACTPVTCNRLPLQSPDSDDRFLRKQSRRHPLRQPAFLCSQTPSDMEEKGEGNKRPSPTAANCKSEAEDDAFQMPVTRPARKRLRIEESPAEPCLSCADCSHSPTDFIQDEAELSGEDVCLSDSEKDDDYNCSDSFINDDTLLTQHVTPSRVSHPTHPSSMGDVYRQSLMSPNKLFSGRSKGCGNQNRLVFSQRYKLLNHYMKQAGIKIGATGRRRQDCILSDSGSEAEEVLVLHDEPEIVVSDDDSSQEHNSVHSVMSDDENGDEVQVGRRTMHMLTDSEESITHPSFIDCSTAGEAACRSCLQLSDSCLSPAGNNVQEQQPVLPENKLMAKKAMELSCGVVISPSLLVHDESHPPPEFSLGMGIWEVSGDEEDLLDNAVVSLGKEFVVKEDSPAHCTSANKQQRPITTTTLARDTLSMLVDIREISNSQVVSILRHHHGVKVEVCSLGHGGFVVSHRTLVERICHSELSANSSWGQVITKLAALEQTYDRVYLVIEQEREKTRKSRPRPVMAGRHWEAAMAKLTLTTNIHLLYSSSQDSTAEHILAIARAESKKGYRITAPLSLLKTAEKEMALLLQNPCVTHVIALCLLHSFPAVSDILCATPDQLRTKLTFLSRQKAASICRFFRRTFNKHLVSS